MKPIRTVAHGRHSAPRYVTLDGMEVILLRKLPSWVRWLYAELRSVSDFQTGQVSTSWAALMAVMDCDSHMGFVPTLRQLRWAVHQLEEVGLLQVERKLNERSRSLFLRVLPVKSLGASAIQSVRPFVRPLKPKKPSIHAGSGPAAEGDLSDHLSGVSIINTNTPKPPKLAQLSTAQSPRKPTVIEREMLARIKPKRAIK